MLITLICRRFMGFNIIIALLIILIHSVYCLGKGVRGIEPAYGVFYLEDHDKEFYCLDGRKKILFARVNDNYCDCLDGSDEPGTSACANARFYCHNLHYEPKFIMSSFVDDGICDCCDGSDESSPPTPCPNTCKEQGEKFLAGLQDELAGIESGLNQREKYIKDAVKLKLKWKSQLQKVERDIVKKKRQVDTMADKRSDLEKREQKLKELQKQQEKQQEKAEEKEENVAAAAAAAVASTPASPPASAIEQEASDDTLSTTTKEGESAENQAKRVAAQWIPGAVKEESDPLDVKPDDIEYNDDDNDDEEYGTAEEEEGDGEEEEEEEEEEGVNVDETHSVVDENTPTTTKEASSMLIRLFSYLISKIFIKSPFQGTFPTTPEGIHSALVTLQKQLSTIRSEHSKETSNLRTLEKEKSTLESNMKSSFGPDDAFAVLVDRCLSTKIDKYTYEVCPYKAAKQKEGSSSFGTDLGQWQGFEEGGFSVMKFGGGSTCWQGPARSMTVSVRCGAKDVLSHVQEPSRCEYTAVLETPAACHQSTKVYLMNRMQQAKDWSIPVVDATVVGLDTGDRIILNPTGISGDNDEL